MPLLNHCRNKLIYLRILISTNKELNGVLSPQNLRYKEIEKHTSTKKAVDRNDLSTKSARVTPTTVTEILAIGLGIES